MLRELCICMESVSGKTVLSVGGSIWLSAEYGAAVKTVCPVVCFSDFSLPDQLFPDDKNITFTALSQDIYIDRSRDFSVACEPLAQAGLCISLASGGFAEHNWLEIMNCRLNFSVCTTSVLPKTFRKQEKIRSRRTAWKAEKFTVTGCTRRQEVLRL